MGGPEDLREAIAHPKGERPKARAVSNESDSASLGMMEVTFLPKHGRSVTGCEAASMSNSRTSRGGWEQRAPKVQLGTWEIRLCGWNPTPRATGKRRRRKSDGLIVAMKRGNARGVKGLYRTHV